MSLFEKATPYGRIHEEEEKRASSGNHLKYLHQGVFPMTFMNADWSESKGGNLAIIMKFDTGFLSSSGEPNILFKHYYMLDKNSLQGFDREAFLEKRPDGRQILESAALGFRTMLYSLFNLEIEKVSSIQNTQEVFKLPGMAFQINKQLSNLPLNQRQVTGTVDYPRKPSTNGRFYLELEWLNPIGKLEEIRNRFKPRPNPNPIPETDSGISPIQSSRNPDQVDDLPF